MTLFDRVAARSRRRRCTHVLLTCGLLGYLLAGSPVPSIAQVRWQMATEYPEANISGVGLATFGKFVSARTNGFVTTVNAFDNELKISSSDMPNAARQS